LQTLHELHAKLPGAGANLGVSFTHGYEPELVMDQVELFHEIVYELE
jgi:hypothetical protein